MAPQEASRGFRLQALLVRKHVTALLLALALSAAARGQTPFRRGDSNGDEAVDLSDGIHSLLYLFQGGSEPICFDAADSNDDGQLDISDPISTLNFLFVTGVPLPPPSPDPGLDPTPDALTCGAEIPGLELTLALGAGIDPDLITGLELVFDNAPGGPPLDLSSFPDGGGGVAVEPGIAARSVDRDGAPELVVAWTGNPFDGGTLSYFFAAGNLAAMPVSVTANLLGARGVLAAALAYELPGGGPIVLGGDVHLDLELLLSCSAPACETPGNQAPVLLITDILSIRAGSILEYHVVAFDPDGDPLTFSATGLSSLPGSPQLDMTLHVLRWQPPTTAVRDDPYSVTLRVTDEDGDFDAGELRIQVLPVDASSRPFLTPIPPQFAVEGRKLEVAIRLTDPEGDPVDLFLDASDLPATADASISGSPHVFVWTPSHDDGRPEPYRVRLIARDATGDVAPAEFDVFVSNVNRPPSLSLPSELVVKAGVDSEVPLVAVDPDGDAVTLALETCEPAPLFPVTLDAAASRLRIQPGPNAASSKKWCVGVRVSDDGAPQQSALHEVQLTVTATNSAPRLNALAPQAGVEGELLTFAASAVDPEGSQVVFSLDSQNLPAGNDATLADGVFRWTPALGTARDLPYSIALRVSDSFGAASSQDVFITVTPRDTLPPAPPRVLSPDTQDGRNDGLLITGTYSFAVDGPADAVRIRLFRDGAAAGDVAAQAQGDASLPVTVATCGTVRFTAQAEDAVGNLSALSAPLELDFAGALSQLEVQSSSTSQTAGSSVLLTITARDVCDNPIPGFAPASMSVTPQSSTTLGTGDYLAYVKGLLTQPGTLTVTGPGAIRVTGARFDPSGMYFLQVTDTRAETVRLDVTAGTRTASSSDLRWQPGPPAKAVVLLPGQTLESGAPSGSIDDALPSDQALAFPDVANGGTRDHALAGETYSVRVFVTDDFFNVVAGSALPAGFAVSVSSPMDLGAGPVRVDLFPAEQAEATVSFANLLARLDSRLTPTLENAGAIAALDSRVFSVSPGPTASVVIVLPNQRLVSGVPALADGSPDLRAMVSGQPFGTGQTAANERFQVEVVAVDRHGNVNFNESRAVLVAADRALATGVEVSATNPVMPGHEARISGAFRSSDFPSGSLVRVADASGAVYARVLRVNEGFALTVDRLDRSFLLPRVSVMELGDLSGRLPLVGQRFATLTSAEDAPTALGVGTTLRIEAGIPLRLSATVDLSSLTSGASIAGAIESNVRAQAGDALALAAFTAKFQPEFRRYVLVSGSSADLQGGTGPISAAGGAAASLKLDAGAGAEAFSAVALTDTDLASLGTAGDKLSLSGGRAVVFIDLASTATDDPQAVTAILRPRQTDQAFSVSSTFVVTPSLLEVSTVELRDHDANGGFDRAEFRFSEPVHFATDLAASDIRLEFAGTLGPLTAIATAVSPLIDSRRLTVEFGPGLPTTSLRDVTLRIGDAAVVRPVAGAPTRLVDLGPAAIDETTTGSRGAVLIDKAPPVLLSTETLDINGDGRPEQVRLVFSEDVGFQASRGVSVGRVLPDLSAVAVAAGDTLAVTVDAVPRTFAFAVGASGADSVATTVRALFERSPPQGFGDEAPDVSVESQPFGSGGRYVLRSGSVGAASSVHVTGGTAAVKLGFDGTQLERPGSDADQPRIESFRAIGFFGDNLLEGQSDSDVFVSGNQVVLVLNDDAVAGDEVSFAFADDFNGSILSDASGNAVSLATNLPAAAVNDPASSGFIRIRDSDANPADGRVASNPGIIRIDPTSSLIDRGAVAQVRVDILDTGDDPYVFVGDLDWARVIAPASDVVPLASLDRTIELGAHGRGANGELRVRIAVDPAAGSPFDLFAGSDGVLERVITVTIANRPPVADAGCDVCVVAANTPLQLDGRGSVDPNAEDLEATASFLWDLEAPSGATAELTGAQPTFTFTEFGAYNVTLRVTDQAGDTSDPDQVTVVVTSDTTPVPSTDAGPDQVVRVGGLVTLDARGSRCEPACGGLRYQWDLVDDDGDVLSPGIFPSTQATPTFTAGSSPGYQNFRCTVTATDGSRPSAPDFVRVIVVDTEAEASIPVARIRRTEPAGTGAVPLFDPVVLTASDSDGTSPLATFQWRQIGGVPADLATAADALTFRPSLAGTYTFELTVTDATGLRSVPARQSFVATTGGAVLSASAGPDVTVSGPVVAIGAGASFQVDASLGTPRFFWSQTEGLPVVLDSATALSPTFMPPASGVYGFRLQVLAEDADTPAIPEVDDQVLIGVSLPGQPLPVASLVSASQAGTITLDGSGSTPAGVEHQFEQADGVPCVLTYFIPDSSRAEADTLEPTGPYRFELTVFDATTGLKSLPVSTGSLSQEDELTFTLTVQPTLTTAGAPFILAGELRDAFGELAVGATGTVTVELLTSPAGAMLGGTTVQPFDMGTVSFADLTVDKTGAYQVRATGTFSDGGMSITDSAVWQSDPGAAVALVTNEQPIATTAGVPFTFSVTARDAFGNLATTSTGTVDVTLLMSPPGSALGGTTTLALEDGAAIFDDLTVDKTGSYQLRATGTFSDGFFDATDSAVWQSSAGAAVALVTNEQPVATTAGVPFTFLVTARDAFGNLATTSTGTIDVALLMSPPGSALGGTTTLPLEDGAASFDDLTVDKTGSYQLRATGTFSDGFFDVTDSAVWQSSAGAAVALVTNEQPVATTAGVPFTFSVTARDAFGNLATTSTGTVDVALLMSPPGSALGGTTTLPLEDGEASFDDLSVDKTGAYQLRAIGTFSDGERTVDSGTFSNGPGDATALAFRSVPLVVTIGEVITPAVEVELQDSFSNLAITTTATATVTFDSAPPGAGLTGTTSVGTVGGVVRFTDLVIDTAGAGYRLQATAPGLTAAVSDEFSVDVVGSELAVTAVSVPPGTLSGAVPVTFTLEASTGDIANVLIEFRRSAVDPFEVATQAGSPPGTGFDGVRGITTSPTGTEHTFLWNSSVDLPRRSTDVTLRVTPSDSEGAGTPGTEFTLSGLVVDNGPSFTSQAAVNLTGSTFVLPGDWNRDGREDLAVGLSPPGRIFIFTQAVNGTFAPGQTINFGSPPTSAGVGDFFRHGTRSLVVAFESTDQVSFVFNFGQFFSPTGFVTVGDGPADVVVEDFNNDHRLDAATANRNAGTVSIVTQSPTGGSFSLLGHVTAGAGARSITVGDFNRDSRPDLATANFTDNTASVLIADPLAPGSFFSAVNYATGVGPSGIAVADLNRDGRQDLVVVNTTDGSLSFLSGVGDSTFGASVTIPIPSVTLPNRLVVADFDKDRLPDVAVAGPVSSNVAVFLQNSATAGTFASALLFTTAAPPLSLETLELNRDGRVDMVFNHGSGVATLPNLLPKAADPRYQAPSSTTLVSPLQQIAIGDLDDDGKPDLAATSTAPVVSVAFGTGNGSLVAGSPVSVGIASSGVTVGRFNDDFLNDIVVALPAVNAVEVLNQNAGAPGSFVPGDTVALLDSPSNVVSGRLNTDTFEDILVASRTGGTVTPLFGTGTQLLRGTSVSVGTQPSGLTIADFNLDAFPDFVVALAGDNTVRVFSGNGSGGFTAHGPPIAVGAAPSAIDSGDLDNDGSLDLVVTTLVDHSLMVLLNDATAFFTPAPGSPLDAGTSPVDLAVFDLDADGFDDVAVIDEALADLLVFDGQGDGILGDPETFQLKAAPNDLEATDLDGDGDDDLAVSHTNGVVWTFSIENGRVASAPDLGTGTARVSLASADLNGDGKRDVAVTSTELDQVLTHLGDGLGGITSTSSSTTGDEPVHVASGDLDADGDDDMLTVNFASGDVSPLLNDGAGNLVTQAPVSAGPGAVAVALGDFNHDSVLDFVTANSGANTATVRFGSTGSTFQPPSFLPAGDTPVHVVVSDLNEDGCLEIAVVNQASNNFMVYFNQSDGSMSPPISFATGPSPKTAFVVDLDLNGTRDLVLSDDQGVSIHSADGAGSFGTRTAITLPAPVLTVQGTGTSEDADDDGLPDLVATSEDTTFLLENNGALDFDLTLTYGTQVVLETPEEDSEPRFSTIVIGPQETPIIKGPGGIRGGGCAIGRFEHLGGPTVQRLAALLTVAIPFLAIALLKRRARREWQRTSSPASPM